jgi:hypothetical protein
MTLIRPTFFYKTLAGNHNSIGITDGTYSQSQKNKLIDGNKDFQFVTLTYDNPVSIYFVRDDLQNFVTTEIYYLILQNTNLRDFLIKDGDGTTLTTKVDATAKDFIVEITPEADTDILQIDMQESSDGSNYKIGQMYICKKIFSMAENYNDEIFVSGNGQSIINPLYDGSIFKNYLRDIENYDIKITGCSKAERDNYMTVYDYNKFSPFIFIPDPDVDSDDWNGVGSRCHWTNGFDFLNHYNNLPANGYIGNIQLSQAGGIG